MKVIDLLNKIANGEEVPKKIKYENDIYILTDNYCYYCDETNLILSDRLYAEQSRLNDEVEILEEEKKITPTDFENLGYALGSIQKYINKGYNKAIEEKKIPDKWNDLSFTTMRKKEDSIDDDIHKLKGYIETIMRTQNEVIDYLKSKGE